jgi:hypothetical protein
MIDEYYWIKVDGDWEIGYACDYNPGHFMVCGLEWEEKPTEIGDKLEIPEKYRS